jgi:hypothetical protein
MLKLYKSKPRLVALAVLVAISTSACAPGKQLLVLRSVNENVFGGVAKVMLRRNIVAAIGFDEVPPRQYNLSTRGNFYGLGAKEGDPEFNYRLVKINTNEFISFGFWSYGESLYQNAAAVPDQLPRLMAGDIVEWHFVSQFDSIKGFTGRDPTNPEVNAVTRVLCRKSDPLFKKCYDALPRFSEKIWGGFTDQPYQPLKNYGYTFSPWYDDSNKLLRAYPEYTAALYQPKYSYTGPTKPTIPTE